MRGNPRRSLAIILGIVMVNLVVLAGCGGGGGNSIVTPPMGNFTDANLKGAYVFSYQGADAVGAPFAAAGQFTADGMGSITGGVMDLNDSADAEFIQAGAISSTTSKYSVAADGETTVTLNVPAAVAPVTTFTLQMTLASSEHGVVSTFDSNFSGSGTIDLQTAGANLPANLAFVLSGVDLATFQEALFGANLQVTGGTTISQGSSVGDIVAPGLFSPADTHDTSLSGGVVLDVNNPGRGTLTVSTTSNAFPAPGEAFTFAFYVIDSTHLKLVQLIDTQGVFLIAGDGFSAPGTGNQQLASGNYTYTVSGEAQNGATFSAGGVFKTDGSGNITGGEQDLHSTKVFLAQTLSSPTPDIPDATFARIDLKLTDSEPATFEYAVYPTLENRILMVEIDQAVGFASGIGYQQTSTSAPSGSFALNLTGVAIPNKHSLGDVQDVVGQIMVSGAAVSGFLNISNIFNGGALLPDVALTSSTLAAPDKFGRGNPLNLNSTILGNSGYGLSYYTVDGNRVLLLETDGLRVSTGQLLLQTN